MTPPDDRYERAEADDPDVAPYQPKLISGKWVIIVVGAISLFGAAFGWLWMYDAQRTPRDFWGPQSWKLIGLAPVVRAQLLKPEAPGPANVPKPAYYDGLVVVRYEPGERARYVIEREKRVENEPGISIENQSDSLREALANYRSYNWESKAATLQQPVWRYALSFSERTEDVRVAQEEANPQFPIGNKTATLLFDSECRFVRVPAVDKPTVLQPSVAEQFKKFFEVQLAADPANPQAAGPAPTATASATAAPGSSLKNP